MDFNYFLQVSSLFMLNCCFKPKMDYSVKVKLKLKPILEAQVDYVNFLVSCNKQKQLQCKQKYKHNSNKNKQTTHTNKNKKRKKKEKEEKQKKEQQTRQEEE